MFHANDRNRQDLQSTTTLGSYDESIGIQLTFSGESTGSLEEEKTSARAHQLQALYELSSQRDLSLNKYASFKSPEVVAAPSLTTLSVKQAAAAFRKKEQEYREECKNGEPQIDERKETLMAEKRDSASLVSGGTSQGSIPRHGSSSAHHAAVTPGLQRYADTSFSTLSIVRNNSDDDWTTCDEMDIRRTGSGGLVMVDRHASRRKGGEGLMKTKSTERISEKAKRWRSGGADGRTVPITDEEAFNRAKALELQSLLENTSNRDLSLNRNPVFNVQSAEYAYSPTGGQISPEVAAVEEQKSDRTETHGNVAEKNGKVYDLPTLC